MLWLHPSFKGSKLFGDGAQWLPVVPVVGFIVVPVVGFTVVPVVPVDPVVPNVPVVAVVPVVPVVAVVPVLPVVPVVPIVPVVAVVPVVPVVAVLPVLPVVPVVPVVAVVGSWVVPVVGFFVVPVVGFPVVGSCKKIQFLIFMKEKLLAGEQISIIESPFFIVQFGYLNNTSGIIIFWTLLLPCIIENKVIAIITNSAQATNYTFTKN
jgi:hypothetical protein